VDPRGGRNEMPGGRRSAPPVVACGAMTHAARLPALPLLVPGLALALLVAAGCGAPAADAPRSAAEGATPAGAAAASAVPAEAPPELVGRIVAGIDPERLRGSVDRLAAFGTRHTLSETEPDTRGIGAARRWMHAELERYAAASGRTGDEAMRVSFDRHLQPPDGRRITRETEIVNVVAELPGASPAARARRHYVVAHYDSRASDPLDAESDAPGANDDASGTALVLELARVMAGERFDATVVFMATAGEEQGLFGARLHAAAQAAAGAEVRGVLSNDVVGDPTSPLGPPHPGAVRVFSQSLPEALDEEEYRRVRALAAEAESPSRELARFVAWVADWHGARALPVRPMIVLRRDRFLRGGDHTAFADAGFPAVRFTEVDEDYARQHQDVRVEGGVAYGDLPEHVDAEYVAGVARLNAAALAHLANAPAAPEDVRILTAELASETTLRWSPAGDPDLAGYEVVWRPTTSARWERALDVGNVTEATLPINKDNVFFGVRAYDRDGYRSPVAFAGAARE